MLLKVIESTLSAESEMKITHRTSKNDIEVEGSAEAEEVLPFVREEDAPDRKMR